MQNADQIDAAHAFLRGQGLVAEPDGTANALAVSAMGRTFRLVFRDPRGAEWRHPIANTSLDWIDGQPDAGVLALLWRLRFELASGEDAVARHSAQAYGGVMAAAGARRNTGPGSARPLPVLA